MKLEREKIRLITNIVYFVIACVIVILLAAFCIFVSIKPNNQTKNDNNMETDSYRTDNKDGTNDDMSAGTKNSKSMNGEALPAGKEFYLIDENEKVSIYEVREGENVFYDYAAVEKSLMPQDMRLQLKEGLYFNSEEELYEFLQTYSS